MSSVPVVADNFFGPVVFDQPKTWLRRPLTGTKRDWMTLPEKFVGSTYAALASHEEGRLFLAKIGYTGKPHWDELARRTLDIIPHHADCECAACKHVCEGIALLGDTQPERRATESFPLEEDEESTGSVAQPEAQGDSTSQVAGSSPAALTNDTRSGSSPEPPAENVSSATQPSAGGFPTTQEGSVAQRIEQGSPTAPVAGSSPAALTTPKKPKRGTIEHKQGGGTVVHPKKPPTKPTTEMMNAEATLDIARVSETIERPLRKLFDAALEEEEQTHIADATESGALLAYDNRRTRREDAIKALSQRVIIDNGWAASWGARTVLDHRAALETAKRMAAAIVDRAERDLEYHEEVLLPKLKEYVEKTPVAERASEKSVRPPGWGGRITLVDQQEHFKVNSPALALAQAVKALGEDECIARKLARVKIEMRVDDFKEYCLEHKAWASGLSGVRLIPKGSTVSLHRK